VAASSSKEFVEKWLKRQGYPLEMVVAQEFRRAGFDVTQSAFYEDQQTHQSREIDMFAMMEVARGDGNADSGINFIRLTLAVECKLSRDKPWVLFTHDPRESEAENFPSIVPGTDGGFRLLTDAKKASASGTFPRLRPITVPSRVAYGVKRAAESNEDVSNQACWAAVKAAVARAPRHVDDEDSEPNAIIALPVVVVDGLLFEAYLNASNDVEVKPIDFSWLLWKQPILGYRHTLVYLVTASTVAGFADDAEALFGTLGTLATERDKRMGV
jgi:hypothetical protein